MASSRRTGFSLLLSILTPVIDVITDIVVVVVNILLDKKMSEKKDENICCGLHFILRIINIPTKYYSDIVFPDKIL